jgi:hypothetical protein
MTLYQKRPDTAPGEHYGRSEAGEPAANDQDRHMKRTQSFSPE